MRNKYYIFNPDTRTYDRVYPNFAQKFLTNLRRVLLFTIFGGLAFLAFNIFIDKPSVEKLESKNSQILAQYEILSRRLDEAMLVLQDMQQRDDNLYRVMLDAEPLSPATRHAGYGGTNRYDELLKMDWLCENVVGTIPAFDELLPHAQQMVRELGIYRDQLPAVKESV